MGFQYISLLLVQKNNRRWCGAAG